MTEVQIDILKTATEWAKAEMLSSAFFCPAGFRRSLYQPAVRRNVKEQIRPKPMSSLFSSGGIVDHFRVGLVIPESGCVCRLPRGAFKIRGGIFPAPELPARKTISGYETAIYRVLPLITLIAAGLPFFVKAPSGASCVSTIAMMAVILVIDTNATRAWWRIIRP